MMEKLEHLAGMILSEAKALGASYAQCTVTEDTTKEFNDPCLGCSNHPKNGGSGICNCTVPYMAPNSPYTITC